MVNMIDIDEDFAILKQSVTEYVRERTQQIGAGGERCPYCKEDRTGVINSRVDNDGGRVRRRECKNCGRRFSTREIIVYLER